LKLTGKTMRRKILAIIGLMNVLLLFTPASAMSIQTIINVSNGTASVNQTVNNQTVEIETNKSASIFVEIKDSIAKFLVQATGFGQVRTNISGESMEVNITTDNETETHSGLGIFSAVYEFFKSFLFSAWIKINPIAGVTA
jgi:hypothetical protein